MFQQHAALQYRLYQEAFQKLVANPSALIAVEQHLASELQAGIRKNLEEIRRDYDEASYLYPFWKNYPPDERGNQPRGDQFPWIEVGEHVLSAKLPVLLRSMGFHVRDCGLPTGADLRYVLTSEGIRKATNGLLSSVWLHADVKSVGPRDDQDHTVMSHNQVSGSGEWGSVATGVSNRVMQATGARSSHPFHCALPPLYVLSDGTVAPVVLMAVKPVYRMLGLETKGRLGGQPLGRIDSAVIPNGILLEHSPGYLKQYPGLLFPGKDDKGKNPKKIRARVSFSLLKQIAAWRVQSIPVL